MGLAEELQKRPETTETNTPLDLQKDTQEKQDKISNINATIALQETELKRDKPEVLLQRETALNEREANITARENDYIERSTAIEDREARVYQRELEYDKKLTELSQCEKLIAADTGVINTLEYHIETGRNTLTKINADIEKAKSEYEKVKKDTELSVLAYNDAIRKKNPIDKLFWLLTWEDKDNIGEKVGSAIFLFLMVVLIYLIASNIHITLPRIGG